MVVIGAGVDFVSVKEAGQVAEVKQGAGCDLEQW